MAADEEIRQAAEEFRAALFACDRERLVRVMDESYGSIDLRGNRENRDVVLQAFQPGAVQLEEWNVDEESLDVIGDIGIVTGRGFVRGRYAGQTFEHDVRFTDVYVRRDGRWRLLRSQNTEVHT